ncbi:ABC transporter permease [Erwinia sp. E_sp_B04_7]|uniref:ABC transporter permease n=1 Tax=unclassified Erwinia TaxID=2622719 RepID=UPI0030D37ED4
MNTLNKMLPGDRIIRLQLLMMVIVLVLFSFTLGGRFFSTGNFQSIATQLPVLGLLALGMGLTMLTGGINLSIIASANACSLLMGAIIVAHPGQPLFLLLALIAGALLAVLIGTLNGLLIAVVGVSPILATLGTMTLIAGLNILLSNGAVISGFPPLIQFLGNGDIFGVPFALLLFLLVAFGLWVLLEQTTLGRSIYLLGSNEQATRFSGVNTAKVQIIVYIFSALLSWGAALLMMSMFNSAKAGYGESWLLVTILASVLGGVNPEGGFGRVIGLVLALIVLQMLESGLNLLGVSSYLTMALWGGVLILFIALQNRRGRG